MGTVHLLDARARRSVGPSRSSSSPATSATRTAVATRLPRGRPDGRPRSVQREQGLRRARDGGDAALVPRRPRPRSRHARAGNVIGGGDWAEDRLVPDLMRAAASGCPVTDPAPTPTRPWQSRARAAARLSHASGGPRRARARVRGGLELRPRRADAVMVELVDAGCRWRGPGRRASVEDGPTTAPRGDDARARLHESRTRLGWGPVLRLDETSNDLSVVVPRL